MRALLATALLLIPVGVIGQQRSAFVVIVHPGNPVTSVDRKFLADAFLKKVTRWPDERVIRPADLAAPSQARTA